MTTITEKRTRKAAAAKPAEAVPDAGDPQHKPQHGQEGPCVPVGKSPLLLRPP